MALFLSEHAEVYLGNEDNCIKSFSDSYRELLYLQEEMHNFTCNTLVESYIHENIGAQVKDIEGGKSNSFLGKVWMGLKAIASKVWARIKDIGRFVARKMGELVARIKSLFTGKNGVIISKADYIAMQEQPRLLEIGIRLLETKFLSISDLSSQVGGFLGKLGDIAMKAHAAGDKEIGVNKVMIEYYQKTIDKLWDTLIEKGKTIIGEIDFVLDAAEKHASDFIQKNDGKISSGQKDEVKEKIEILKEKLKFSQKLTEMLNRLSSQIASMKVVGDPASKDVEDAKIAER